MVSQGESKYTWDDFVAAVGQDFASEAEHVADETISHTDVVRYCEPWEIGDPIYWDEKAAKQAGYRGIVVPWSAIKQTFCYNGSWRPGDSTRWTKADVMATGGGVSFWPRGKPFPKPPTSVLIYTDQEVEFFEPVIVGDRLTAKGFKLDSVRPRKTRVGDGAFYVTEVKIYNQLGQLVARTLEGCFAYSPEKKD